MSRAKIPSTIWALLVKQGSAQGHISSLIERNSVAAHFQMGDGMIAKRTCGATNSSLQLKLFSRTNSAPIGNDDLFALRLSDRSILLRFRGRTSSKASCRSRDRAMTEITYTGVDQSETIAAVSGTYTITADGAEGGSPPLAPGGAGAEVSAQFVLQQGDVLEIVVGGVGGASGLDAGGGGGGTFVDDEDHRHPA